MKSCRTDAEHQQHRNVSTGLGAEGGSTRCERRLEKAVRKGVERLRGEIRENRKGEETTREGGWPHSNGSDAG